MVFNPLQKIISGERLTVTDSVKDAAFGATIGKVFD